MLALDTINEYLKILIMLFPLAFHWSTHKRLCKVRVREPHVFSEYICNFISINIVFMEF